jgi:hypothetical protein
MPPLKTRANSTRRKKRHKHFPTFPSFSSIYIWYKPLFYTPKSLSLVHKFYKIFTFLLSFCAFSILPIRQSVYGLNLRRLNLYQLDSRVIFSYANPIQFISSFLSFYTKSTKINYHPTNFFHVDTNTYPYLLAILGKKFTPKKYSNTSPYCQIRANLTVH